MNAKSFLAAVLATTLTVHAQETADPYKKVGAAGGAGAGAAPPEELLDETGPSFLSIREETFSLPIAAAYELLHRAGSDVDLYAKLVEQMKLGNARIERLLVLRTKSGQRAVVESINELRYSTEYDVKKERQRPQGNAPQKTPEPPAPPTPASADEPFAVSFDTRNVGDTLELEPILGPDGHTIDLNLVPQSVRFAGYQQSTKESWARQPLFQTQKLTTSITVRDGVPAFLGTLNPPFGNGLAIEQKEQRVWLDFLTADVVPRVRVIAQTKTLQLAKSIVLAKLEFREATVGEAIEFLRAKSVELDPAKQGINFVLKVPASIDAVKITLSLKNVPLAEALKYVTQIANLEFTPQENALVIHGIGWGN